MTTRRHVVTFALAAPLLAATGCGVRGVTEQRPFSSRMADDMDVYAWSVGDEVGQSRQDFAAERLRGVNIRYDQSNFDPQKFSTLLASGNVPDVVVMDRLSVGTYAAKGLIRPLDEGFELNAFDPRQHYYPATLADVTYEGKIYGVPQFFQPVTILVNKRVMERSGVALEDLDMSQTDRFLDAVRAMYRGRHGKPQTLGLYPAVEAVLGDWLLAFGGRLMDEEGKPSLNHPRNAEALRFLKRLFDVQGGYASVTSYFQTFDQFGEGNQYVKDQVGADVYAQWYPNVLTATADKISIAAVPMRDRGGAPQAVSGGMAFVVPSTAANPAAACKWAMAMTSDAAWMAAAKARQKTVKSAPNGMFTGLFTGSRTADALVRERYVKTTDNPDFNQVIEAYYEVVGHSKSLGASAASLIIRREMNTAATLVFTGEKKSVEKALDDAQEAALYGYDRT